MALELLNVVVLGNGSVASSSSSSSSSHYASGYIVHPGTTQKGLCRIPTSFLSHALYTRA
ncbi:hypothetical protein Pyn_13673 [Prunus yedoensis var. nudiflora]|uniref:Uncharacterized protein n=1 Tax=Prunus yedoensis var. nudiflora TaxID=2094558 RepID=A0A314YQI5_PRUYE|nr:hypothetical protein Pyn_13673 [Prunus yedoensis var. nudiflora]